MPKERNAFRLGLTLLVALGLFVAVVVFIGGAQFDRRVPIVVRIGHNQNMPRLKKGAPVICGPQQVGSVTGVSLTEGPRIGTSEPADFLYFEINAEVNASLGLREDCLIVVEGPLLGDNGQLRVADRGTSAALISTSKPVYAESSGLVNDLAMITDEFDDSNPQSLLSQIKTQLDPKIPASLVARIHRSMADINAMTENLRNSVDPTRDDAIIRKVESILSHINTLTSALKDETDASGSATMMAKVHRSLDHIDQALVGVVGVIEDNREGIGQMVGGAERVVHRLDATILPAVEAELSLTNTGSLLAQAHTALETLNHSLTDVGVVTDKARRVATLGEDRIITFIDNAKQASDHLKAVAKDLRRNPWRLIHKPDEIESKQAYVFDAVREFTEAAAEIDDSAARLSAMLEAGGGTIPETDPNLAAIREKLTATMKRFSDAEDALWKQLDVR